MFRSTKKAEISTLKADFGLFLLTQPLLAFRQIPHFSSIFRKSVGAWRRSVPGRSHLETKEAILRLVDEALSADSVKATPGSFLDGIEDLVGSVEGPADLSQNPKYMEGYGR